MLRREMEQKLQRWLKEGKAAFMLTGARQIGKTYLIRECLKQSGYPFVELNFIEQPELVQLFQDAADAKQLLLRISLAAGKPLEKGKTIFFFDEVQECRDIVTRIKFLVEEGSYRYILSGSLLGVELNDLRSAPVGYMQIFDMYPMCFAEFANACGIHQTTVDILQECFEQRKAVDSFIHEKMLDLFYLYLIIGGMPEAVSEYLKTNDLNRVGMIHQKILRLYKMDFSKYEKQYKLKLREIYDAMATELDSKNKRFRLNTLGKGINYDRVVNDFLWLKDAGVAFPVYNVSEPKLPLKISENRSLFKLFFSDVGLLTSQYSNNVKMQILNKASSINNGALFENVIAQELVQRGIPAYYFNSKKQGELDFVIELDGKVLPIEVKSGKDYKKHCALENVLADVNYQVEQAYIFSDYNVEVKEQKIYLPVYMIMFLKKMELQNPIYKLDLSGL
nr:AAA family ATPase [uncultured Marvinbryantia sp.]